ncbi:MBL fold metallo-hydrolase [Cohnella sp.]|uniref:MBL fold metallo-hydrolase n=1 Tax=Cohnella sp. TaxID=1883426 RepID=UPI003703F3BC
MLLSPGIAVIELTAVIMGKPNTIYPVLLWDEHEAVLVDTGYPGQADLIGAELEKYALPSSGLSRIILSHQDIDHIGSLPVLVQRSEGKIAVMSSPFEKPYIEGNLRLLRITPEAIEQAVNSLPANVSDQWKQAFRHSLEHPPSSPVHETLEDGQELLICGGIVVIATPGHTPGHLSLYHRASKTLIAADALTVNDGGELCGPDPVTTLDPELARHSLTKLLDYEITTVVCYHGGLYQGNVRQNLLKLAQSEEN